MRECVFPVTVIFSLILAGGCGSDDPKKEEELKCTQAGTLCARVLVPQDFSGNPVNLMALFFNSPSPAGMPSAILAQIPEPDIGVGKPLALKAENITAANGRYYFFVALYMEGGGSYSPVEGVDYVGSATAPVDWEGGPANVGDVTLSLYHRQ